MSERLLHVYPQVAWHDDVHLVGNRAALEALREAIDVALKGGTGSSNEMTSDGEHYDAKVILEDSPWQGEPWSLLGMPYLADYAVDQRQDAVWPESIWHERSQHDRKPSNPREG